jgi:hypothetical protein
LSSGDIRIVISKGKIAIKNVSSGAVMGMNVLDFSDVVVNGQKLGN